MPKINLFLFLLSSLILFDSCSEEDYYPLPRSYYRVDFDEKKYKTFEDSCAFTFKLPNYSFAVNKFKNAPNCYKTIIFPKYKAELICTYNIIDSNFYLLSEKLRTSAYEHSFRASSIVEKQWVNVDAEVYGTTFEIIGDVACNYTFYLSDSTNHFFTGELMFFALPNYDSLKPTIEFLKTDIEKLVESFEWK